MAGFLILMLIFIHVGPASATIGPGDGAALLAFASGVSGDPGGALDNWGAPGVHVCNWTGITCDSQHVVQLDLSRRGLSGVVSPVVSNLSLLSVLDLSENSFHGEIPTQLGALSELTQLSLKSNLLQGSIPSELGLLQHLVYLDLGGNRLTGPIPNALFCNTTSLQYIDLSNNSLIGQLPVDNQCSLLDLRFLLLWSNNLVGNIPPSLSNSSKLQWIDLESNYFSGGLPFEVFDKMPYLQFLYLSYNNLSSHKLDSFFGSLANCSHLQELELAGNRFTGEIPPSIGALSTKLVQLHLEENRLSGPVPPNITNLVNLTYLNLSNNLLNGSIPPDISRMGKLERVYLSNNLLSGVIPPSIGKLPHLGLLDISGNKLSGQIPGTLSNLSQLRRLMLHNNQLSGMIPTSLGDCINLEILDLSYNRLAGRIPTDIAGLKSLKLYLNLSSNFLQGPLPFELSKMDMILALDLSSNNLSGAIPRQLGSCVALEYLNLSRNVLQGFLPSSVGALPYLKDLDLSLNRLTGTMPESLQASSSLRTLNLSFNNFSGVLPSDGLFASLSLDSFLGNPDLCGSISGMPACSTKRVLHHSVILPLLLSLLGVSFVLFVIGYPLLKKSRKKSQSPFFHRSVSEDPEEQMKRDYPKISYRQLVEATEDFSDSNLIGSGRFGHVYKGLLLPDQTRIAVKVLYPKSNTGEISASFRRECQVLKRTRHRNLIRIITTCSRPDFKALVLPLMPNGSLESHLYPKSKDPACSTLSLIQVVSIVSDVAEGMTYLHHYSPIKVVHCDLKPSNVLLDEDMTALVADFGIAKLMKGGTDESPNSSPLYSTTGLLCGSVGYIPPEYGLGGHPTVQGDVYSFGVLLLEIITGKRPTDVIFHEGLTLHEWVKIHYPHDVEPILRDSPLAETVDCRKLWRDVMNELIELGLVCTLYSPSMRPTMMDVAHEIAVLKLELTQHGIHVMESSSSVLGSPF